MPKIARGPRRVIGGIEEGLASPSIQSWQLKRAPDIDSGFPALSIEDKKTSRINVAAVDSA